MGIVLGPLRFCEIPQRVFFQQEEEAELFESSPRELERDTEIYPMIHVESANTEENKDNLLVKTSTSNEMKDFEENLKVIDRRLLNIERRLSIIIPLLKRTSNDEV